MLKLFLIGTAATLMATSASAEYHHGGRWHSNSDNRYNEGSAVATLQRQLDNVMRSIGGVRPDQRDRIRSEALDLDRQVHRAARDGLSPGEYHVLDVRLGQLERQEQAFSMNRGYRHYGRHRA